MIPIQNLPTVNAILNASSAILLAVGYFCIRSGKISAHRFLMGSAFCSSTLFLISYLTYHYYAGSKHFQKSGVIRSVYLSILFSHTLLAVIIVPLALITVSRALRGDFQKHKKIARWTFPLWMYVSVTGVIVYWMLYRL
ncbi:MAG TPA: DUF420 domain-containing protein [Acidobacteriota bacterium]